jgi:two-component sensor histidine kinase
MDRKNEITVRMATEGDRGVLEVYDNGVGLPVGMDAKNTKSLGLRLVSMPTRQLKGLLTVDVASGKETRFTIAFPLETKGAF